MPDLLWPGDERAGDLFSDSALLAAMVRVETAWLDALAAAGIGPAADLSGIVAGGDIPAIAAEAESGGNPVIPLVALLRSRLADPAATWLHRGLTSQDVLDTAVMLCARDVVHRIRDETTTQVQTLVALAERHRGAIMAGRTLTQHAVPITFGLKAATWLTGVLDAEDALDVGLPGQFGGAAGTLAAATDVAALAGLDDPPRRAVELADHACAVLGLKRRPPWQTSRGPISRLGDALVGCCDAWGRIANDVLTLSRPEIGELGEARGGGSSTMPHKANPVLSVLIRRAALTAPAAGAQLHLAAAEARDERPDAAWHVEWATLRTLARRTVIAASQTSELLAGLRVDTNAMRANVSDHLLAERHALAALFDRPVPDDAYLGATDRIIDDVVSRAEARRR